MYPCPFCGVIPHLVIPPGCEWRVECQNASCPEKPRTIGHGKKSQAQKSWERLINNYHKAAHKMLVARKMLNLEAK